jgi:hypothetical protein
MVTQVTSVPASSKLELLANISQRGTAKRASDSSRNSHIFRCRLLGCLSGNIESLVPHLVSIGRLMVDEEKSLGYQSDTIPKI